MLVVWYFINREGYEDLSKHVWFELWKYKYMMVGNGWNTEISCERNIDNMTLYKGVKEEMTYKKSEELV